MRLACFLLIVLLIFPSLLFSADNYSGKKILYINSYHEGYEWSDGIEKGVRTVLGRTPVALKTFRMDVKRNAMDPEFIRTKSLEAKKLIEDWQPDVVITSDDAAFKEVVMPYFKDVESVPVVFCGLNWDASVYGAPYKNTTGMVEVALVDQLIDYLKSRAKGQRIGYLAAEELSERKEAEYYRKIFNLEFLEVHVKDFSGWKEAYLKMQDEVDMLIFFNDAGIAGWNQEEAVRFIKENTKIPTGSTMEHMSLYTLVVFARIAAEQGEWAAESALRILNGEKPSSIPVVTNQKGELRLNLILADKLGVIFPPSLLRSARYVVTQEGVIDKNKK